MRNAMTRWAVILLALLVAGPAAAQQQPPQGRGAEDRIGEALFAPDLVMQNAQRIGLTRAQRDAMTTAIQELQGRAVALQFQMLEEVEKAILLLEQPRVDEREATAALNRVLDIEQQVKVTQSVLLIRIKNILTPEQQAQLREIRKRPPE